MRLPPALLAGATVVVLAGLSGATAAAAASPSPDPARVSSQDLARSVHSIDVAASVRTIDLARSVIDLRTEKSAGGTTTVTINSDVLFAFDSATLTPVALTQLDAIAAKVAARPGPVAVAGFTDSVGAGGYNQALSQRRADAVAARLRARAAGIAVTAVGYGSARPVAPNRTPDGKDNPAGRTQNRRVTITYRTP